VTSATLIEKCCLIANPVAGNPTHYIIEQAFAHRGLDWRFMTFEVEPQQLADAIRGIRALGFRGVKIGEPFHESVLEFLDELTERAKHCGSVNLITANGQRLVGDNTEGAALVDLVRRHLNPTGVTAIILGAGRLARSIALTLASAGVAEIIIASRSEAAANALATLIQEAGASSIVVQTLTGKPIVLGPDVAILVNATSASTAEPERELPIDVNSLRPQLVVCDVAYNTGQTWLLRQAAERGCRAIEGVELYVEQTAAAIRAWTDDEPDTGAMREAAEEFLGI
jgi:shikimate dehydrogenase